MHTISRREPASSVRPNNDVLSVIVPTTASKAREQQLLRAIDSICGQVGLRAIPIVVLNGDRYDPDLRGYLSRRTDIRYVYHEEGSLPVALRIGRSLVDTEFFAELDDDDELLPTGLAARVSLMRRDESADLVVTNGYLQENGRRELNVPDFRAIEQNPIDALMRQNWLPSCAGLFRTCRIGPEFFENVPSYLEWTYLALRISLERNVRFLNEPTFVCNVDTQGSLSKSKDFVVKQGKALHQLLQLNISAPVLKQIYGKYAAALHHASTLELADGNYFSAWKWHILSMCHPSGVRYATYTRYLLGLGRA